MSRKGTLLPLILLAGGALVLAGCDQTGIDTNSSTGPNSTTSSSKPSVVDPDPSTPWMDEIVSGASYKLGLEQKTLQKWLWLSGEMSGYYLGTTETYDDAVDVVATASGEGYTLQVGSRYVAGVRGLGDDNKVHNNIEYSSDPFVWSWNTEKDYFYATLEYTTADGKEDNTEVFLGNSGNYNTISLADVKYLDSNNIARLFITEPEAIEIVPDPVDEPAATITSGTRYHLGLYNDDTKHQVYFTGEMAGHYGGTSRDIADAASVIVTSSGEGYTFQITGGKNHEKYLGIVPSGEYIDFDIIDNPYVWNYNTEKGYFYGVVSEGTNEVNYYLGSSQSYDTISVSKAENLDKYDNCWLLKLYDAVTDPQPIPEPSEPDPIPTGDANIVLDANSENIDGWGNGYSLLHSVSITGCDAAVTDVNITAYGAAKQDGYFRVGGKNLHTELGDDSYGYFQLETPTTAAVKGIVLDLRIDNDDSTKNFAFHKTFASFHAQVDDEAFPTIAEGGTTTLPESPIDSVEIVAADVSTDILQLAITPTEGESWAAGSYFRFWVDKTDNSNNGGIDFVKMSFIEA